MARKLETADVYDGSASPRLTLQAGTVGSTTGEGVMAADDSVVALRRLAYEIGRMVARSLIRSDDGDTPTDALFTLAVILFAITIFVHLTTTGSFAN